MAELITPDLCVIGAGIGGLTAVADAAALGASVVLIERDRLGGDNLGTGSIPSKALAAAAARAQAMRTAAAFGISADEPKVNSRKVHDYVEGVIASLSANSAAARVESLGVQVVRGEARFTDPKTVQVGDIAIRARRFVIATGARSVVPTIPGLDGVPYFTSETIFDNTRKLTHLVIVGGGPIGLELAQSYRRLGTEVTLVEPTIILDGYDPELAGVALQRLREEGVAFYEGGTVTAIQARSQGIGVMVKRGNEEVMLDVSHILVAQTRVPNIDQLDLDKAGIKRRKDDAQFLEVSSGLKTSNNRVYAIGDVAGGPQYGHLAAWQARLVVKNALLGAPIKADPTQLAMVVHTDPEIAEVGLRDNVAMRQVSRYTVVRSAFANNDRAKATRTAYGLAKMLVSPTGKILGAGAVGERAGELVALFALAIGNDMTVQGLLNFVAPHPTFAAIARDLAVEYSRTRGVTPVLQRLVSVIRLTP